MVLHAATPTHRPHEQHAGSAHDNHTKKGGTKVGAGDKEESQEKTLKMMPGGLTGHPVLVVEPARVGATFQVSSYLSLTRVG